MHKGHKNTYWGKPCIKGVVVKCRNVHKWSTVRKTGYKCRGKTTQKGKTMQTGTSVHKRDKRT